MRKIWIMLFCAITSIALYAGDVANFVNLGFSADGSRFVFGQFGITDTEYRAYAEIYCVDIAKNDFVRDGKFATAPSDATVSKDGKGVFAALQNTAAPFLRKQGIDSAVQGRALYVQAEDEPRLKNITFRDFETGTAYEVVVHTLTEGAGAKVQSSFYLSVTMTAPDGKVTTKTIGLPGFKRTGIRDYLVRRILTDASGKSLVFIIEKEQYEPKGSSVRFMVETVRL